MNLIVVGASYRNAPVELLERLSRVNGAPALSALVGGAHVTEAVLLSTCNRVEVYAAVPAFHAGLTQVGEALASWSGVPAEQLAGSLYVQHGVDAVRHLFRVASGLDSMVVGEAQILGQLREAYQQATEAETVGRVLHELLQQALRVGKRAHAETGIDAAGRTMVSAALDVAGRQPGSVGSAGRHDSLAGSAGRHDSLAGRNWLVVGAGAMGAMAVAELTRREAGQITVVNRGEERARRLAESYGCRTAPFEALPELLATADCVITATASVDPVLTVESTRAALASPARRPGALLTIIDLALPRDVAPAVGTLDGVDLIDVEQLAARLDTPQATADLLEVERIVADEVESYQAWLRGAEVAPTVAALRMRADDVVGTELRRLVSRRPEFSDEQRAEVSHAVHRIVQRLLHQPTVRVRQLAAEPGGEAYAQLLRDLFDLDPHVSAVAEIPDVTGTDVNTHPAGPHWAGEGETA